MSEMSPGLQAHAVRVAKEAVHTIMKAKVELARMGALTGKVDEYMTAAGAEIGVLILAAEPMEGITFMLSIADEYRPQYEAAVRLHQEELTALEAEEFANRPQDK